jgi:anti-sigma factor RsiW
MCSSPSGDPDTALNLSVNQCPKDVSEVADLYCLHRLTPEQERVFEEHYLHCPACAEEVARSHCFIAALKTASSPPQAQ